MARVSDAELERLKKEVSVQRLAEARGIKLHPHGKNLIGLCPFHDDKEPSLVITPEKNLFNCLGACGTGGTVIDWVMKAEGVSFRHAVEILREGLIPQEPLSGKVTKKATVPKLPNPVSVTAEDRELMHQVVDYYHETLKKTPQGLSYLEKRGLNNSEMIEHFKIGYANRTIGLRLPEGNRKEGAAIRENLKKIGIYRDTGREHFCGAVVFPIFDENGDIVEIYGRKTCHKLTSGLPYHMYLPGPHKGVFNLAALQASKDIIICEAVIDALTFWCAGFRNVTASYGINGFTADHLAAFKRYNTQRVYIAYDRDAAGDAAANKLAEKLMAEDIECFRILFPKNMDANDYACKTQPAAKALDLVFRNAVWLGKGSNRAAPSEVEEEPVCESEQTEPEPASVSDEPATPSQKPKEPQNPSFLAAEKTAALPPTSEPETEIRDEEVIITLDDRRWRVRGLNKNMSYDQLKVNILVSRGQAFFVDTFDLYSARGRAAFLKQASEEMRLKEDVVRMDLGKVLLKLEELQDKLIKQTLEPEEKKVVLTPEEHKQAMELLTDKNLLKRILKDFEACGVVGEESNKLVGYLSAVSRKLENPLAIIIQSSSAAGKTSLMEAVLAFMPEEERVKYSAMTGQSLFYMGETSLKNKILAIVEEEGAERASYAIKLLQSEGELTIASTGKDPASGKLVTHEYHVEGPVMIFVTTTSIEIDEELLNRCIMLTVNESREQTRAIHVLQRQMETLEGLLQLRERDYLYKLHRNAQRLLKPILVANPYARHLTFLDDTTRTRRDNKKYLTLIRSIALLHQFQRPHKTTVVRGGPEAYIEVTIEDIELANELADEVLGRSLDELPPQTRRLLMQLEEMVDAGCGQNGVDREYYRFTQREVREYTGFGNTQVKTHLRRLEELEYIIAHRQLRGQSFSYELAYDGKGKDGRPFFHGLLDIEVLKQKCGYDTNRSGQNVERSGSGRPQVMHLSGVSRTEKPVEDGLTVGISEESAKKSEKSINTAADKKATSYLKVRRNPVSSLAAKSKGNGSENTL
ncbi:MAG: DNA primase [Candidatus Wallbacteria bacterium HGW-Wallbacteria-1]|jgi:DNA primase catalytic core|uniref:DNA primase n=1 Tax=Candidatus Wallbacteria bacterium HGW-Wallbacteria-1 TaxID=2013854 RepID=A0A2N1PIT2_9BACT|nr:MAG: DNA primase [Candidatus Wallbacteria bacterium HGW-Wallbacteria-1]